MESLESQKMTAQEMANIGRDRFGVNDLLDAKEVMRAVTGGLYKNPQDVMDLGNLVKDYTEAVNEQRESSAA